MRFFDLHCHPGLKTLFKPQDGTQFSAWHTIEAPNLFGDILSNQSSLEQLSRNLNDDGTCQVPLVCITLHPPESGMLNQFIIKAGALLIFSEYMDLPRLKQMYSGVDGYQKVFAEEFTNLTAGPRPDDDIPDGTQVVFLQNWADYDPSSPKTVHVVFNIEGSHGLYPQGIQGNDPYPDPQQSLDNLQAFLDKGYCTLYLTPTHLTPNAFITHAYGNKILTKGPLLPRGLGITSDGKALIDFAYSKGLLIDVKHMSLVARMQFYHIHDQFYRDKPIIASHAGLTGCFAFGDAHHFLGWSTDQHTGDGFVRVNGVNTRGIISGTSFYPLSINLFDDDIAAILRSGGLIGLSMDVRILGGMDNEEALVSDYLTPEEFELLNLVEDQCRQKVSELADALWAGETVIATPSAAKVADPPEAEVAIAAEVAEIFTPGAPADLGPNARAHARLLANHLLQIRFVAEISGLSPPWNNICIGSDFDGLIQAVDCCKNVTALGTMAGLLEEELAYGAAELHVNLGISPQQIVEQVCYTNAFNFINKHFGGLRK